jgi:hypothetical protein
MVREEKITLKKPKMLPTGIKSLKFTEVEKRLDTDLQ